MDRLIVLGDDPNPNREIAISLEVAAIQRRHAAEQAKTNHLRGVFIGQAKEWIGEARRLRQLREEDERSALAGQYECAWGL